MAMESLLIIIVVLAVLLIVGVPISYSIGISALIAILRTVPLEVSVVTGAQRILCGHEQIQPDGHSLFYPGRKPDEPGRHRQAAG